MYYNKVETYAFTVPEEYKAYLNFKDSLICSGVAFREIDGGSRFLVIEIRVNGKFDDFKGGDIHET